MNWKNVHLILVREVRDQLRDRRTLFMIFVLPLLLYPLLGMSLFQITQFIREQPTKVLVVGFRDPPNFPKLVRADDDGTLHFADELFSKVDNVRLLQLTMGKPEDLKEPAEPEADAHGKHAGPKKPSAAEQLVQSGAYEAVVYFPADFNAKLNEFRDKLQAVDRNEEGSTKEVNRLHVPSPRLYYNTAKEKSQLAYVRLREVLEKWTDAIGQQNLASRNLPALTAKPFDFAPVDVAEEEERDAALWSKILPFLLLIWALTGAFYPAVDLCAGEKERGTLETLLSSPAERNEIVWGKLLTVMLFSVMTAVLNILSMGITGSIVMSQIPNFGPPPPLAPIWLFLALLPMSALFSALCIALASFAKSTKEGQYYLMPLVLVTMPLVILPMAPSIELNLGMSLIPVTGVVLLLKAMLEGRYLEALPYIPPVAAVTGGCCLLAVRWAVDQFNSENVLFRESERGGLTIWFRHLLRDREDTPSVAGATLCGVLIMTIYFFMSTAMSPPTTFATFMTHAVVTQLVVIFLPAMLMTVICARSVRQTLLLYLPRKSAIPAAILLALALHPTALVMNQVLQRLYPVNPELLKFGALLQDGSPWIVVAVFALIPAVFEELAFRGFILSGFRHVGHRWRAIVLTSLFFGLSHGAAVQQAINAGILGLLLGYLAVQSGSILTGIAFHMTHNAAALVLPSFFGETIIANPPWSWAAKLSPEGSVETYHPFIVAAGIIVAGAILRRMAQWPTALSYEEELTEAIRERSEQATAA
jgi:sodium transport system permease protein